MAAPAGSPRSPVASAGWVVAVLVAGLLVLLLLPSRREEPAPPPPVPRERTALEKLGLPNNVDLEGLPGFFDLWADRAPWREERVDFAYRHPVSGEFSYFFEATRTPAGVRFRLIVPPRDRELLPALLEDAPVRFFAPEDAAPAPGPSRGGTPSPPPPDPAGPPGPERVKVDLAPEPAKDPRPDPSALPEPAPPK